MEDDLNFQDCQGCEECESNDTSGTVSRLSVADKILRKLNTEVQKSTVNTALICTLTNTYEVLTRGK